MPFLLPAHVLQPNSGAVQVGSALHRQPGTAASGAGVSAASSGSHELIGKLSALSLRSLRSAASHGAHSLARLRQQVRGASARSSPRASAAQNCCSSCRPTSPERPKTAPSGATAPARGDVLVSSRSHRVSTAYKPCHSRALSISRACDRARRAPPVQIGETAQRPTEHLARVGVRVGARVGARVVVGAGLRFGSRLGSELGSALGFGSS